MISMTSADLGDDEARALQMQSFREAVGLLQEELEKKTEELTAFKQKTKTYVESKTKQHAEALEAEVLKTAHALQEVDRLKEVLSLNSPGSE